MIIKVKIFHAATASSLENEINEYIGRREVCAEDVVVAIQAMGPGAETWIGIVKE